MCSPYPKVACAATVESIQPVGTDVFSLVLVRQFTPVSSRGDRGIIPEPIPGQFFMLRARPSGFFLVVRSACTVTMTDDHFFDPEERQGNFRALFCIPGTTG